MRTTYWLMTAVLGLPIVGCGGTSTAPSSSAAPTTAAEARQALAPTGKLRVALQLSNSRHYTSKSTLVT